MIATGTLALLRHLRLGQLDPSDIAMLEGVAARKFAVELKSRFQLVFQERWIGKKWEVSMSRSIRAELVSQQNARGMLVSLVIRPVYANCVMLNSEDDLITGITWLSRLSVRAVKTPEPSLVLKSGHGYKLDKTVDGWVIKPMDQRTVRLSEPFLQG